MGWSLTGNIRGPQGPQGTAANEANLLHKDSSSETKVGLLTLNDGIYIPDGAGATTGFPIKVEKTGDGPLGTYSVQTGSGSFAMEAFGTTGNQMQLSFRKWGGTRASPSAISAAGWAIGSMDCRGAYLNSGVATMSSTQGKVEIQSTAAFTDISRPTRLIVTLTPTNSVVNAEVVRITSTELRLANTPAISPGVAGATVFILNVTNTAGLQIGTSSQKIAFLGATPVVQQPAIPDTTGATIAALETEVNKLKAIIRTFGFILPA